MGASPVVQKVSLHRCVAVQNGLILRREVIGGLARRVHEQAVAVVEHLPAHRLVQPGEIPVQGEPRPLEGVQAQKGAALLPVRLGLGLVVAPDEIVGGEEVSQGLRVPVGGLLRGGVAQAAIERGAVSQVQGGRWSPTKTSSTGRSTWEK